MEPSCTKPPARGGGARKTATTDQGKYESVPQSGGSLGRAVHPSGASEGRALRVSPGVGWPPSTQQRPSPSAREGRSRVAIGEPRSPHQRQFFRVLSRIEISSDYPNIITSRGNDSRHPIVTGPLVRRDDVI